MSKAKINAIARRARAEAFPVFEAAARKVLPPRWDIVLAVGWGVFIRDENGLSVGEGGKSPHRLTKPLSNLVEMAEHLGDVFWLENEVITSPATPTDQVKDAGKGGGE